MKTTLCLRIFAVTCYLLCAPLVYAQDPNKPIDYETFKKEQKPVIEAYELSQKNPEEALKKIEEWKPVDSELKIYRKYWQALWNKQSTEALDLYKNLKKEKKYIRLRLTLLKKLLESTDEKSDISFLKKESRFMLKQLKGTSEGELFESLYLKWLQKNKFYDEVCHGERRRWITEPSLDYIEVVAGLKDCPMNFEEKAIRIRRLIFAAEEFKAQKEIEMMAASTESEKLDPWQKAYLQAIYDSNVGDPVKAFKDIGSYEKDIMVTDYDENFFYISQRAGEYKKAEELISRIIQNATGKKKKEMEFQQGFLFYQTRQYESAFKVFDRLYKNHPARNKRKITKEFDQIAWMRAWTYFLDGKDYQKSLDYFEQTQPFAQDTARLNYWMAVNMQKLGKNLQAAVILKKLSKPILDQKPFSFYNLLAWVRHQAFVNEFKANPLLQEIISLTKSNRDFFPTPDDQVSRSQLLEQYNSLADQSFVSDEGDIQVVNTENEVILSNDMKGIDIQNQNQLQFQLDWAQLLIENFDSELAKWHLFEIERTQKNRKSSDRLSEFYLKQKFYYRALSLMQRLGSSQSETTQLKSDEIFWLSTYPEAYKDLVMKYAEKRKVDPYFMFSIMKAETQYKQDAISPVGAIGLMQFMPYTANKIANLISENPPADKLFEPETSIKFGSAYIKKLTVELEQQKPLMAAAYNGGPHRVKAWIKNLGQLNYDVFIEHIPFAETRTYVKRVMTYRSMYDKLYGSGLDAAKLKYLIDEVPYKPEPQFKLTEEWDPYKRSLQ